MERDFIMNIRQSWGLMTYSGQKAILFHRIQSVADTHSVPAYADVDTMSATLQHLHMSELLQHDDDAIDTEGPNDVYISRMSYWTT